MAQEKYFRNIDQNQVSSSYVEYSSLGNKNAFLGNPYTSILMETSFFSF